MLPDTECRERDCPVCYVPHDEDIHQATLRLHRWFHYHVTHRLQQEEFFAAAQDAPQLVTARVA